MSNGCTEKLLRNSGDYGWQQLIKELVNDDFAVIITEAEEATTIPHIAVFPVALFCGFNFSYLSNVTVPSKNIELLFPLKLFSSSKLQNAFTVPFLLSII